jgi:hypothetical protein
MGLSVKKKHKGKRKIKVTKKEICAVRVCSWYKKKRIESSMSWLFPNKERVFSVSFKALF